jgi:DNA-binding GntR family transcriptional regulator
MSGALVESETLRATVHERVRETLRNEILSGALRPGEHLRQSALAAELQVSVSPVREALRDLAAEGFVRFDPRRGASVRMVDLAEFLEIRTLMETLEPLAARLAAERITADELDRMRALQERLELVRTPEEYTPLNTAFHDVLTDATRSPRLQAFVESLNGSSQLVVAAALDAVPHRVEQAVAEHRPMLAALAARDPEALTSAALAHRRPTWDAVEAIVRRQAAERKKLEDA